MSRFIFLGDPGRREALRDLTVFGILFPAGKAVSVADERIAGKLRGNSHFREMDEAAAPTPDPAEPKPIGAMEKDELEAFARERFGLELDKRKSLPNLRAEVQQAALGALDHGA